MGNMGFLLFLTVLINTQGENTVNVAYGQGFKPIDQLKCLCIHVVEDR